MRKQFTVEVYRAEQEKEYKGYNRETQDSEYKTYVNSSLRILPNEDNVSGILTVRESLLLGQKFKITIDTSVALSSSEDIEKAEDTEGKIYSLPGH